MILSRSIIKEVTSDVEIPDDKIFQLPEKILQFGTGVLLRCLPDYFIDQANKKGIFNGRIVVVKSTNQGDTNAFDKQDNLYTILIRGKKDGLAYEKNVISSSISRVLTAQNQWPEILKCAHNADLKIIISNTTENGIQYTNEKLQQDYVPVSFPAKLLAFLIERYKAFEPNEDSGMVIIPTELLSDNGKKLFDIIIKLALYNNLDNNFITWLRNHNHFCNSLVDRIVPGHPDPEYKAELKNQLGYDDDLSALAEPYSLWAIEGDEYVKKTLSFADANEEVKIEKDIKQYKELKLRILNGTHSLSCGLAHLAGFETVFMAMENPVFYFYVKRLITNEILPILPFDNPQNFAGIVLDRFSNPYIQHKWMSISQNYSLKIKERTIPILLKYYEKYNKVPELFAVGFAAYILFMRPLEQKGNNYYGINMDTPYLLNDNKASLYFKRWNENKIPHLVWEVLSDTAMWNEDLTLLPGFYEAVNRNVIQMDSDGVKTLFDS